MVTLAFEIISQIVAYIPDDGLGMRGGFMKYREPTLVPYALISRDWQYAVEMHTFSSPRVNSNELTAFARIYGGEPGTSHRILALRKIGFRIQRSTPRLDKQQLTPQEQESETREDNAAFQDAFKILFEILNSWNQKISIILEIHTEQIYGPKIKSPECIPMTSCIKELVIKRGHACPRTVISLAQRTQGLCGIGTKIDGNEPAVNSVLRRKERFDTANQLQMLRDHNHQSLRYVELTFDTEPPENELVNVPSVLLPNNDTDHLSQSLRNSLLLPNLETFILYDAVISSQLFRSLEPEVGPQPWQNLTHVEIGFSRTIADGGWCFDEDPARQQPHNPDAERARIAVEELYARQEQLAREMDFSKDITHFPEDDQDYMAHFDSLYGFRMWPSSSLEALLVDMARAVAEMPKLEFFSAGARMSLRATERRFEFFYLAPGKAYDFLWDDFSDPPARIDIKRLYWSVPEPWRMRRELKDLWMDFLDDGDCADYAVEYKYWTWYK